jgi:hypothetical protein
MAASSAPGILPFLSLWQVAQRAGVSPWFVRKAIWEGALPAARLPGSNAPYLIMADDAERWLAGREALRRDA